MQGEVALKRAFTGAPWESKVGYCRAIRSGNTVAVTGTTSLDDTGKVVGAGDAYAQTKRSLEIIERVLKELGAERRHVVRTRMFVTDISRWQEIGRAHGEFFANSPPATTMVEVKALIDPQMLVEIEADAIIQDAPNSLALNQDTVEAVLQTVREEYLSQERRHAILISKTQTLATVAAIIVALISASVAKVEDRNVLMIGAFFAALIGIAVCLYALLSRSHHKVSYEEPLKDEEMSKPAAFVMGNLAKTYHDAIDKSEGPIQRLTHLFDAGVWSLILSLVLGGIALGLSFMKGTEMSNDNNSSKPAQQHPAQPSQPQPSTGTSSYGTNEGRRSIDRPVSAKPNYDTKKTRGNGDK